MAGNILNFNAKKLQLRLSDSEYWDFYLAKDEGTSSPFTDEGENCFVVHYDFNNDDTFISGNTNAIYSLETWTGATNTGYTFDTIGLTGIDNGLVTFEKLSGDSANTALLSALTGTTLVIPSGDTRLTLHRVTGMTGDYVYPIERLFDVETDQYYMNFCGGFYQGYYKIDGTSYEVLPNRVPKAWTAEFWLNKRDDICPLVEAIYDDVPMTRDSFSSHTVTATLFNHKLEVGDPIVVSGSTDSIFDSVPYDISAGGDFFVVSNVIDDNTFQYVLQPVTVEITRPSSATTATGTIKLYDKDEFYSGVTLTKPIGNDVSGDVSGITTDNIIYVDSQSDSTDIETYGLNTSYFIGEFGTGATNTYNKGYARPQTSGFTYETTTVWGNPIPNTDIADITSYSVRMVPPNTILNDIYPENKGIFFYMGTRAENKFWNQFEGLNTGSTSGCTSGATEWCTIPKEMDISVIDDASGVAIPLNPPPIIITEISNQFLIYGRAQSGGTFCNNGALSGLGNRTACNFTGDSIFITSTKQVQTDFQNPFLIYGRATSGGTFCNNTPSGLGNKTACSYSGDSEDVTELDWAADVVDNAMAFMIKDDGSLGVRWLTYSSTCVNDVAVSGCSIQESFSASGCVQDNQWTHIAIRFVMNKLDDCELEYKDPRKGKLMFYVNCRLKHTVEDFDEMVARRLQEHWKKQVGVPFNISLGGGSQGLLESMTFDGQDPEDLGLCIQENFAGTFIGGISEFKFNICDTNWCELKSHCEEECERYGTCSGCSARPTDYLLQEDGDYLLQENGSGLVI